MRKTSSASYYLRMAFYLLTISVLLLSCSKNPPRSGMQLARERDMEAQKSDKEVFVFETSYGDIVILPLKQAAPTHCREIKGMIERGFYNGLGFHYVEPGRMIQGGDVNTRDDDPSNDGAGDPGFNIKHEPGANNVVGAVGLAHPPGEPDAGNSQFYILLTNMPELNGRYTVFGQVVEGMDVVREISRAEADENGHPLEKIEIRNAYIDERFI